MIGFFLVLFVMLWQPNQIQSKRVSGKCVLGCVEIDNREPYVVTRDDVLWLTKVVYRESGPRFRREEASATMWTLVQGWTRDRMRRGWRGYSLARYVQRYSAACSEKWATGGTHYNPRITPRADRCRSMRWDEIPRVWFSLSNDFFHGRVLNKWPGAVHILARGFERFSDRTLIGPEYATDVEDHPGGNAYYRTLDTMEWGTESVRVVPANIDLRALRGELQ